MSKKLRAEVVNLIIDENIESPTHKRILKKKIKQLAKKGRLTTQFLQNDTETQIEWGFRVFAASMILGDYSWWGWETRSRWAWEMANLDWHYPRWEGQRCKLLVIAEQGIGDELLFTSCAADLAPHADVFWEVDDRLLPILRRSIPEIHWITRWKGEQGVPYQPRDHRGPYDAFIPAGNVPKLYRQSKSAFPRTPFLIPDWDRVAYWSERLQGVGYVNKAGAALEKRADVPGDHDLHHHEALYAQCEDFDDFTSLVNAMDYVNAVPSAVVHLCGATGQTCNVIMPEVVRGERNTVLKWYYPRGGGAMDWYGDHVTVYPNAEMFRRSA